MKKLVLPALAVACLLNFNCTKDDAAKEEASIIGTWKINKHTVYNGKTNAILEEYVDQCEAKSTYEYTTANKINYVEYVNDNGNCTLDNVGAMNYSYDKTKKELSAEGFVFKVVQLIKTTLEMTIESDENGDGVKDKIVSNYTRQ